MEDLAAAGIYALTRNSLDGPTYQSGRSPPDPRDISECEGLLEVCGRTSSCASFGCVPVQSQCIIMSAPSGTFEATSWGCLLSAWSRFPTSGQWLQLPTCTGATCVMAGQRRSAGHMCRRISSSQTTCRADDIDSATTLHWRAGIRHLSSPAHLPMPNP